MEPSEGFCHGGAESPRRETLRGSKNFCNLLFCALICFACKDDFKIVRVTDDYTVVKNFEVFINQSYGLSLSDQESLSSFGVSKINDNFLVYLDTKDSTVYINNDYGKVDFKDILYEVWKRRSYLIFVCNSKESPREKEFLYSLVQLNTIAGKKLLDDLCQEKFNKTILDIPYQERIELWSRGTRFALYTRNINDPVYYEWITMSFPDAGELFKRDIPREIVPDH